MKLTKIALATSLIAGASLANAEDPSSYAFGLQMGIGSGGDTIMDGQTIETATAGDYSSWGAFVNTPTLFSDVYGKVVISLANEKITFINAEETFTRLPIDFLLMKKSGKYSYGAGITYHLNPSHEVKFNDGDKTELDYSNALGLTIEVNRTFVYGIGLGLRYTNIKYSGGKQVGNAVLTHKSVDGSNFAITAGITF